jgi:hypothetical protein
VMWRGLFHPCVLLLCVLQVLAGLQSAASALVVLPCAVGSSLEQLPLTCLVAGIAELLMVRRLTACAGLQRG